MVTAAGSAHRLSLDHIVAVLAEAHECGYDERIEVPPEDDPLMPVCRGINALLDALAQERRRSAAYRRELEDRMTTIELQRASIREISTPIIEVWRGAICLPLIGIIDPDRGEGVVQALLARVAAEGARYVVIDVTGVVAIDASTARWLLGLSSAVSLLGARCVLTGIRGELAEILVKNNLDLTGLTTLGSVRDALERYAQAMELFATL